MTKHSATLEAARRLVAEKHAQGLTPEVTAPEVAKLTGGSQEQAARALAALAKAGSLRREVRKRFATVAVRWGFGGSTACVRRTAYYRVVR